MKRIRAFWLILRNAEIAFSFKDICLLLREYVRRLRAGLYAPPLLFLQFTLTVFLFEGFFRTILKSKKRINDIQCIKEYTSPRLLSFILALYQLFII